MKKLTAVEWLENEFQEMCKDFGGVHSDFIVKFEQAKEMEKEQIMDFHLEVMKKGLEYENGEWDNGDLQLIKNIAEQYYNETFKSE